MAGAAARTRVHASSGVLAGAGGQVAGAAARAGAAVVHDATGALSGGGAQITGSAAVAGVPGVVVTKGGIAQEQRRRREQDEDREQIRRDLERAMGVVLDEAPAPIVPAASEEQQEVEQVRRIKATYQRGAAQSVDWSALAADVQATQLILDLYERMKARRAQEDEDELLMMLM